MGQRCGNGICGGASVTRLAAKAESLWNVGLPTKLGIHALPLPHLLRRMNDVE